MNKTSRKGAHRAGEPDWTEAEVIIVYAASPPPERQKYNQNTPWVREIADLLGRTPASVSFHLGNLAAAADVSLGLSNFSAVVERVVARYAEDPAGLHAEAVRLRREYFTSVNSPRLETELTEEEYDEARRELERRFPEARLPAGSVILYRYEGSIHVGVAVLVQTALAYPQETLEILRLALQLLGKKVAPNPAADLVLTGRIVELAERELVKLAPALHYSDLDPRDRVTMAAVLPGLKSLKNWKPQQAALDLLEPDDQAAARERISRRFSINAGRLCVPCMSMLSYVLADAIKRHKL